MREIRTLRIEEAGAGDVTMEEMRTQTTIERVVMVTLFLKLTRQFSTLHPSFASLTQDDSAI